CGPADGLERRGDRRGPALRGRHAARRLLRELLRVRPGRRGRGDRPLRVRGARLRCGCPPTQHVGRAVPPREELGRGPAHHPELRRPRPGGGAMIAVPAVDLRGGRCVQLVGGRPEEERVSLPDPVAVAERWWAAGFTTLHVVDLDAALGVGDNLPVLERLLGATPATTQVGGGVRDDARIERLLGAGADRVVVGTKAIDDPEWLASAAARHPGRLVLALDTR